MADTAAGVAATDGAWPGVAVCGFGAGAADDRPAQSEPLRLEARLYEKLGFRAAGTTFGPVPGSERAAATMRCMERTALC